MENKEIISQKEAEAAFYALWKINTVIKENKGSREALIIHIQEILNKVEEDSRKG